MPDILAVPDVSGITAKLLTSLLASLLLLGILAVSI
jgi:hypothetical protein